MKPGKILAQERRFYPCSFGLPRIDRGSADILEICNVSRNEDQIMDDRGCGDQAVGIAART
jgi:hypothetical protein